VKFHQWIGTSLGIGYLPKCPGTWGSLAGVLLVFVSPTPLAIFLLILLFAAGTWSSQKEIQESGKHDPQTIVIDEVVGAGVGCLFLPKAILFYLAAFLIFRFLDIRKPGFIRQAEALPGGWGVMLDDLLAGIFTNIVLQMVHLIHLLFVLMR
jgi:phosphatidylglycerophosphatase A